MKLIDADTIVTVQFYDDEHEEYNFEQMTIADALDCWTEEGCPSEVIAQEPRVLTLDEVKQHNNQDGCVWFEQPTYNAVAAFVRKEDFEIEVISSYILGEPINHGYWTSNNYGKTWRCWDKRPTEEQREGTPWSLAK